MELRPFKLEPLKPIDYHFFKVEKTIFQKLLAEDKEPRNNIEDTIPQVEAFLRKHFKRRKTVYPSDVTLALGLDYSVVRETFDYLLRENKIDIAGNKVAH